MQRRQVKTIMTEKNPTQNPANPENPEQAEKEIKEAEDIIQLFTTPVENLSDEELDKALTRMSEMRKTRIATKKKQDYIIDIMLPKLGTNAAEKLLKKLKEGLTESNKSTKSE